MPPSHRVIEIVLPIRRASGSYPVPNAGYFIQQITRREAGTLFDEGTDKNRAAIPIVNKKPPALESGRLRETTSLSLYIVTHGRSLEGSPQFVPHLKPLSAC